MNVGLKLDTLVSGTAELETKVGCGVGVNNSIIGGDVGGGILVVVVIVDVTACVVLICLAGSWGVLVPVLVSASSLSIVISTMSLSWFWSGYLGV